MYILSSGYIHIHILCTCGPKCLPRFVLESVTSLQCEEGWWFPDAALMSGWGGLWSMYVSRTARGVRREGGLVWDHWSWLKHESRRPTLPISCLHFISILPSVISALLKRPMKALPQINVCVFYGPQMIDFIRPPLSFIPFFAPFPCLL